MSHLVKQSQLKEIAEHSWTKTKERYDGAFNAVELTPNTGTEKKLKFTKVGGGNTVDVDLVDYARLQDRNKFKQDVSVDDAKTVSNSNIGTINGTVPAGSRTTGYRELTSKLFTDGYVKLLRIYLPDNTVDTINAHVWMIKKGAAKTEDKLLEPKKFKLATVITSGANKYIDIEIERKFTDETFFVVRTEGNQQIQGINQIKSKFRDDIINVDDNFRPTSTTDNINWDAFNPQTDSVGHMELHGRTGIVDISKRLEEINLASGNYVLQSETATTGGTGSANKVPRLGGDGKLDKDMLPAIAINEYFTASDFTDTALAGLTYQNGDVVVVTKDGKTTRYLCVNKTNGANSTNHFVPLNSKDGIVTKVNNVAPGADGNVTVTAEHIKYNADTNAKTVKAVLDEKVSNITLKANDKKKLEITKATGVTSDVDLTEAFKANNVAYGKQIAGANKATVEEAIDALVAENGKSVKTIKHGRPNAQGDMDVTVAEGGTDGIQVTFGTGGTAVKIATYMTDQEVTAIKNLFV